MAVVIPRKKNWKVTVSWQEVHPVICRQRLTVIEDLASAVVARQFDMQTGAMLDSRPVEQTRNFRVIKHVCGFFRIFAAVIRIFWLQL